MNYREVFNVNGVVIAGVSAVTVTVAVGCGYVRKRANRQRVLQKAADETDINNQGSKDMDGEGTTVEIERLPMQNSTPQKAVAGGEVNQASKDVDEEGKTALADPWEKERLQLIAEKEAAKKKNQDLVHVILSLQEAFLLTLPFLGEEVLDKTAKALNKIDSPLVVLKQRLGREIREKKLLADQSEQERLQLVKEQEHIAEASLYTEQAIEQVEREFLLSHVCKLTLDPTTVGSFIALSENDKKATRMGNSQPSACHRDGSASLEVRCREGLSGRCYWEIEWSGVISISVTNLWYLSCNDVAHGDFYQVVNHNGNITEIPIHPSGSNRLGVYLDMPAGIMSFYRVSPDTCTHLYNAQSIFLELQSRLSKPFYPRFNCWSSDASVYLCEIEKVG